ncbi:2Fe-2S iron-sulfur cluster-binding protein [Sulfurimonas sp. HSL-3221]|uniref:succinate dehydrogenase/fumarate reductase iron-sulfur subunit n=1 Tax=Sulfurimonadaceae TaxID=2771471 RepID=UPI001E5AB1DB|nr:2Fe-2S iron-sulfur cluster-binding protein [Sulfurimonas sp. HSL-3221]UFS62650.1 2Fe-2S iron-sulfur cluster-binding protein [Sulfurimonas sp. HSL-3221]
MKIAVKRGDETVTYDVDVEGTLLELLTHIKTHVDPTLTFASGCRSSVCGSCAVRVNGTEALACSHKPADGDLIEPLRNAEVLRDLVVNMDRPLAFNAGAQAWIDPVSGAIRMGHADEKANELQSDCILCGSCYSACPVYAVKPDFEGPFALTRSWRYVSDARTADVRGKLEAVQQNGIWDCTLCNECVPVCPQGIAPKQDINMLRSKSGMEGFMDPNMMGGFGGLDFGAPSF